MSKPQRRFQVFFIDPENPDERNASLKGEFTFLYARGRPAQQFP